MMHGYGFGMWGMWLFGLLVLAGLAILILVIVRIAGGGIERNEAKLDSSPAPRTEEKSTSRLILDERYARGELTTEEYRERLTVLGENL